MSDQAAADDLGNRCSTPSVATQAPSVAPAAGAFVTAIDGWQATYAAACERRFALAQQVGRLTGAIKLALLALDAGSEYPTITKDMGMEAARVLRLALDAEETR